MENIKTVNDYISVKEKLKNKAAVYEEIIELISDDLGFKYFSNLDNETKKKIVISYDIQLSHYMNLFFDATHFYNEDERNVFYVIAQFLYSMQEDIKWEEKEKLNPTYDENSIEYVDLYYDRMFEYFEEFDVIVKKNNSWEQFKSIRNDSMESGYSIAMAFYMLFNNRIEEDYVQKFCKTLDEYICFISHTDFYESQTGAWLEKLFGLDDEPYSFELPN